MLLIIICSIHNTVLIEITTIWSFWTHLIPSISIEPKCCFSSILFHVVCFLRLCSAPSPSCHSNTSWDQRRPVSHWPGADVAEGPEATAGYQVPRLCRQPGRAGGKVICRITCHGQTTTQEILFFLLFNGKHCFMGNVMTTKGIQKQMITHWFTLEC